MIGPVVWMSQGNARAGIAADGGMNKNTKRLFLRCFDGTTSERQKSV